MPGQSSDQTGQITGSAPGGAATTPFPNASPDIAAFLKDRLKERKKDTFQNLLYPIEASRVQLEKVHALLGEPPPPPCTCHTCIWTPLRRSRTLVFAPVFDGM